MLEFLSKSRQASRLFSSCRCMSLSRVDILTMHLMLLQSVSETFRSFEHYLTTVRPFVGSGVDAEILQHMQHGHHLGDYNGYERRSVPRSVLLAKNSGGYDPTAHCQSYSGERLQFTHLMPLPPMSRIVAMDLFIWPTTLLCLCPEVNRRFNQARKVRCLTSKT